MKKLILTILLLFVAAPNKSENLYSNVTFEYFYSTLSPYGEWIQIDANLYAWRPYNIRHSWRPYMIGRWCWTVNGWYWDSFEPFGWAVYHYGRWYYDDFYGWIWIPDYQWAPAWVEWRYDDDYIGWAPLPPYATFRVNLGIHFSIIWHSRPFYWSFVPYRYFCNVNVHNYLIDYKLVNRIFPRTRYRTNYYDDRGRIVNGGIDKDFVERKSGSRIYTRSIQITNDYDNYRKFRGNERADKIIEFTPSEREISKYKNFTDVHARRYSERSSLRLDKMLVQRNNVNERKLNGEKGDRSIGNNAFGLSNESEKSNRFDNNNKIRSEFNRPRGYENYNEEIPIFRKPNGRVERRGKIYPENRTNLRKESHRQIIPEYRTFKNRETVTKSERRVETRRR
ncbi:DUF6600 domain-containing protein [Melioribacteraceae bacterium 4301-Me]|uniref:DUF6600 domain-containing protein n=1 Tax=Pyranulibacter aquaticus TaxID=3163344 RepID=UPI00359A5ADE